MQETNRGDPLWVVVLSLVALVALVGGGAAIAVYGIAQEERARSSPAAVDRFFSESGLAPVIRTLRRTHPEEYEGLRAEVRKQLAARAERERVDSAALDFLIAAGARHRVAIADAPHASFSAYRRAEIALLEALRAEDPAKCGEYVMRGAIRDAGGPRVEAAAVALRVATWEAAAAGRDRSAERPILPPGPNQWAAVGERMQREGMSGRDLEVFGDARLLARSGAAFQCRAGLAYYRAIETLPDEEGDLFYAFLIADAS